MSGNNPDYEGPDLEQFVTLEEPGADELRSIPLDNMVLISFPDGQLGEWYWDQPMLDDALAMVAERGPMKGHAIIHIHPNLLKKES